MTMNDNENPLNSLVLPILIRPILLQVNWRAKQQFTFNPKLSRPITAREARCGGVTDLASRSNESGANEPGTNVRAGEGNHS